MNRIDIALIHDVDVRHQGEAYETRFREAIEGACRALADLRAQGIVSAIGIGVNEVEPCIRFARHADLDCIMLAGRYTLLEQNGAVDLLSLAEEKGFSLLIAGPFNSGILATGARAGATHDYRAASPKVLERVCRLEEVCARHAVPLGAAAIQFPLGHPRVAAVVTGAVRSEEIVQNAAWIEQPVPDAFWAELRREGFLNEAAATPAGTHA